VKNDPNTALYSLRFYLLISFIEGAAVMVCELLSARMIAPFYGTTLFVWSAVIGVTLAALAIGYYLGGYLGDRFVRNSLLFSILGIGSILMALMPVLAKFAFNVTFEMGVRGGSLVSALIFLLPPLVCLGTTSPIIIRLAARDVQHTGRTAGTVYAVSTISGILATFLLGFYIIPEWGITKPAYFGSLLLGIFPIAFFLNQKSYSYAAALIAAFLLIAFMLFGAKQDRTVSEWKMLYNSEGLLGQVMVMDRMKVDKDSTKHQRVLFVNKHPQTSVNVQNGYSLWPYAHAVAVAASIKPPGSKTLILGLGAGSVADEFFRLGFDVDACELDERIVGVARDFFRLDSKCNVFVDDARHYVRTNRKVYDVIVMDMFSGEQPPAHLLTAENFSELRQILKSDGLVIINFTGFITGELGLAARSIVRTLIHSGFYVKLIATPGKEDERNLVFVASPSPLDYAQLSRERQNICCTEIMKVPIPLPFREGTTVGLSDALVFTDDKPNLDVVHLKASETWRKNNIAEFSKVFHGSAFYWD
jgi:spermidine synthase